VVAEGHLEEQLLNEDDQSLNPVLWVTIEREGVVGEEALASAIQTFEDTWVDWIELVSNSIRSPLGSHCKALAALLLLVLVAGHHRGSQRGAVLVVHLHPVLLLALQGAVLQQVAVRAAQERVCILHLMPPIDITIDTPASHRLKVKRRHAHFPINLSNKILKFNQMRRTQF
jgi:hypothetical protein